MHATFVNPLTSAHLSPSIPGGHAPRGGRLPQAAAGGGDAGDRLHAWGFRVSGLLGGAAAVIPGPAEKPAVSADGDAWSRGGRRGALVTQFLGEGGTARGGRGWCCDGVISPVHPSVLQISGVSCPGHRMKATALWLYQPCCSAHWTPVVVVAGEPHGSTGVQSAHGWYSRVAVAFIRWPGQLTPRSLARWRGCGLRDRERRLLQAWAAVEPEAAREAWAPGEPVAMGGVTA